MKVKKSSKNTKLRIVNQIGDIIIYELDGMFVSTHKTLFEIDKLKEQ